jgi:hypothetical protein
VEAVGLAGWTRSGRRIRRLSGLDTHLVVVL